VCKVVLTPASWLIQWIESIGFSSLCTQPLTPWDTIGIMRENGMTMPIEQNGCNATAVGTALMHKTGIEGGIGGDMGGKEVQGSHSLKIGSGSHEHDGPFTVVAMEEEV
jgi:hypothetical protein